MRHLERGADRRQVLLGLLGGLSAPLLSRGDAQRAEEIGRGRARIAGLAEDRVQSLAGQVMKHKVDDGPRIVGLWVARRSARKVRLVVGVHDAVVTSPWAIRRSQLETVPRNNGFTLIGTGKRQPGPRRLSLQKE